MTETQIIKRKILLKSQAVKVIRREIAELRLRLTLTQMKVDLETKIAPDSDPVLSRKLDCIIYLLENCK
ncbi:MAG: hypothetical protein AB2L12_07665 [Smithellaceae bacterium]